MSPTHPSTKLSSSIYPPGEYRVIRKRNRIPVSCAPCRNRKLKCNRSVPCENCVKRNDVPSCTYAQPKNRKKPASVQGSPPTIDGMQDRIDRLENLVLSLMVNGTQSVGTAAAQAMVSGGSASSASRQDTHELDLGDEMDETEDESDTEQVTKSFGIMKVDAMTQKSYYVSEGHWTMILADIAEVRQYFLAHKKVYEEQVDKLEKMKAESNEQDLSGPSLLFGAVKPPSATEILSSFPSRYTADMLITRYFQYYSLFTNCIHSPSFQKEYERHWEDPTKTSIVWIGMVFAMFRLAMISYHDESDEPRPEFRSKSLRIAASYRNSMVQCLILADYTKPHRYLIETLILHLHGESTQEKESEVSVWVLIGVIVRLAMQMGYHRDSKMFPNISPFQGEIRRRLWTFIRQADLLFSFQIGLPSMIRGADYDIELPRNLYDADFDQDSVEIPPERPLDEPTPVSFLIVMARLVGVFGQVLENTQGITRTPSYEEVMELDHALREARDRVPEHMAVRPLEGSNDSMYAIKLKFLIASTYHKAQCVLHRRYMHRGRENSRYAYSRRTCIASALELLRYQRLLYSATKLNDRFRNSKGYATTGNTYGFLMASSILSVDVYQMVRINASDPSSNDISALDTEEYQETLAILQQSMEIWNEGKDHSLDAFKATGLLDVLLSNIFRAQKERRQQRRQQHEEGQNKNAAIKGGLAAGGVPVDQTDEKQNAAVTLGLLSGGVNEMGASPSQFAADPMMKYENVGGVGVISQGGMMEPQRLPMLSNGMGMNFGTGMFGQMAPMQPFDLDWQTWDSYVQAAAADPNMQSWPIFDFQAFSPGPIQLSPPSSQQDQQFP
ncbi:hypothetical protein PABG_11056 [Paracoccidioides brasiliensis Pb03]|nr:hypothetical protein PABG_11056 [Paracoccidioides brasiliensis Pb03]